MGDVFKLRLPELDESNTGRKDLISPHLRKRKFHLDLGAQMGSLSKHTTALKENSQLRKRLNQTFFSGGPNFSLQKEVPRSAQTPRRTQTRARRRLNSETTQQLITSTFSPRNRTVDNATKDPEAECLVSATIGVDFQ